MISCPDLHSESWFAQLKAHQPVRAALLEAIFDDLARVAEKAVSHVSTLQMLNDELDTVGKRVFKLSRWLVGVMPDATEDQIQKFVSSWAEFAQSLHLAGWDVAQFGAMAHTIAKSRPRGRPPDRHNLAIIAYEMKLLNQDLIWDDVASRVCDCKKTVHDQYCTQAIRQAVMRLQRALKQYRVCVPIVR